MGDFSEAAKAFKRLSETARRLESVAGELEQEALGLALEEAKSNLILNLSTAIAFGGEFQREGLERRLYRYFEHPSRVTVSRESGVKINVNPEEAKEQWLQAQAYANYIRQQGKTLRGWALDPSPAQRRAYWRNKIYPDNEKWAETIETRLAFLNDPAAAPFWYFLEYGTGPGAFPQISPQRFVQKTMDEVGGFQTINEYLKQMTQRYADKAARALDVAIATEAAPEVIVQQEVRWTEWYSWRGRQRRHQYIPGQGMFKGLKVEIK
jgi:hypothetical protein